MIGVSFCFNEVTLCGSLGIFRMEDCPRKAKLSLEVWNFSPHLPSPGRGEGEEISQSPMVNDVIGYADVM